MLSVLIGAVVGGIVGALANGLYRAWHEKRETDRELEGLLYLIVLEIDSNETPLQSLKEGTAYIPGEIPRLKSRAWEDSRTRLARLVDDKEVLQKIAAYYQDIDDVRKFFQYELFDKEDRTYARII